MHARVSVGTGCRRHDHAHRRHATARRDLPPSQAPLAAVPGARRDGLGAWQRGPTFVAEHLWTDHGILVARSTLRDWMRDAGLWSRTRRGRVTHTRRERMAHFGELMQLDGHARGACSAHAISPQLRSAYREFTCATHRRFAPATSSRASGPPRTRTAPAAVRGDTAWVAWPVATPGRRHRRHDTAHRRGSWRPRD